MNDLTRARLAILADADRPAVARRSAARDLHGDGSLDDDSKTLLVHLLNEDSGLLASAVFELLQSVDHWIVVGVHHGLLVRCQSSVSEQMPHDDGLADADLGEVVDLEDVCLLVPRLAAPSPWLRERWRERQANLRR